MKVKINFKYIENNKSSYEKIEFDTNYKKKCKGLMKQIKNELLWNGFYNSIDTRINIIKIDLI